MTEYHQFGSCSVHQPCTRNWFFGNHFGCYLILPWQIPGCFTVFCPNYAVQCSWLSLMCIPIQASWILLPPYSWCATALVSQQMFNNQISKKVYQSLINKCFVLIKFHPSIFLKTVLSNANGCLSLWISNVFEYDQFAKSWCVHSC